MVAMFPVLTLSACESEPAALTVDGLSIARDEVLGLSSERLERLGEITAFGLAVSAGEEEALGEPLVARAEREYLGRVVLAERAIEERGVPETVLRARYRTDPALELTVRHLIVLSERYESDAARAEARAKAERALERIRSGEPFPSVAAEVSEEPGAEGREGLLDPGREGAWVPEFWNAASALDPGEISGVVETQYGFHVLRLEDRDTVSFEAMRPSVVLEVAELAGAPLDLAGLALPGDLTVDDEAVALLRRARTAPSGAEAAGGAGGTEPADSTVVARWSGGRLTLGAWRRDLAALPMPRWTEVHADEAAARSALEESVRLRHAVDRARERGVSTPDAVLEEARREWSDAVTRWRVAFRFERGMPDDAVKEVARAALGATGQGATLAREDLYRRAPLLRTRYAVRVPTRGDAS